MKHLNLRKALIGVLILLAVLCLWVVACAEHSGTWGNLNWRLDDNGTLTISGNGEMDDFPLEGSTDAWRAYAAQIGKIVVNEGVTSIGSYAFISCGNDKVLLPPGLKTIGFEAFLGSDMTDILLPDGLTRIGDQAFAGCDKLSDILIPEGITELGWACFSSCYALRAINLPKSLTKVGYFCFDECVGLTDIVLPENVSIIDSDAFYSCSGLRSITFPNGLKEIGGEAFYGCNGLTEVTIPSGVKKIGGDVFGGCKNLQNIYVADGNTAYTSADGVLFTKDKKTLCSYPAGKSKTDYTIPNGTMEIMNYAFEECNNLRNITFPNTLETIRYYAFAYCSSLLNIAYPDSLKCIEYNAFEECKKLKSITMPKSVTEIGDSAFSGCLKLKDVYYGGTEEDREKISVEWKFNDVLFKATWHYQSKDAVNLSKAKIIPINDQVYTGKEIKPKLTVIVNGERLVLNTDYAVTYSNNRDVGKATVTIIGIGNYTGTNTASFTIIPKRATLLSLKAGKRSLTVKWKKMTDIDGYEIQYSPNKDFTGAKKVTINKAETTSHMIKKLKAKRIYYVRIRTFKKIKSKKYYSEWSKVLSKKVE